MARTSNREKILASGLEVVHAHGFAGASVRDIVQAAGVPQGSFTNHFGSKEAFGLEIIDLYCRKSRDIVEATLLNGALPPLARLADFIDRGKETLACNEMSEGCLLGNLAAEASHDSDRIRERLAAAFEDIRTSIAICLQAAVDDVAQRAKLGKARHAPLAMTATVELGPFRIESAETSHDAMEPVALVISTPDASIGVAYDLGRPTAAVRYLLRERTALVLEANHDDVLLRTSGYPPVVQQRIAGAGGHLSNRVAAELLAELVHAELAVVVLAHLSARCNTRDHAYGTVAPALAAAGFAGALHVAGQDEPTGPFSLGVQAAQATLPLG